MRSLVMTALRGTLLVASLSVAGTVWAAGAAKPAFKPDIAKGQALAAACMACHTADGSRGAPTNPILQGQHPEYLIKQLKEDLQQIVPLPAALNGEFIASNQADRADNVLQGTN